MGNPNPQALARTFKVSEVFVLVKKLVEGSGFLRGISVVGEIFEIKNARGGFVFFSLRDPDSPSDYVLPCIVFPDRARYLRDFLKLGIPESGKLVEVFGSVEVYPRRAQIRVKVEFIREIEEGVYARSIQEAYKKLKEEGLVDLVPKISPGTRIRKAAVISSPNGVAIFDLLRELERKRAACEIIFVPSQVQGREAVPALIDAAKRCENLDVEAVIVSRGGGPSQDFDPFNDIDVVRAIIRTGKIIISAIGHSVDRTLLDMVASFSIDTPTAAANLFEGRPEMEKRAKDAYQAVRETILEALIGLYEEIHRRKAVVQSFVPSAFLERELRRLSEIYLAVKSTCIRAVGDLRAEMERFKQKVGPETVADMLREKAETMETTYGKIKMAAMGKLSALKASFSEVSGRVRASDPFLPLKRGFAVLKKPDGTIVTSVQHVKEGEKLEAVLDDGRLGLRVESKMPKGDGK